MRIGLLIPSLYRGGAERVLTVICNELVNRGHEVSLILTEGNEALGYNVSTEVTIYHIDSQKSSYAKKSFDYIKRLINIIKLKQIEVVVSFITRTNLNAIIACKLASIPVIVSERNNPYLVPASPRLRFVRDFVYKWADGLVFQTEDAKKYFSLSIQKKSTVIINPVDSSIEKFRKSKDKRNVIITACRLAPQKNVGLLIKAFALISSDIPEYKLEIFGEGNERNKIEELIKNLGLENKVSLMGQSESVIEKVSCSKIFVLSSNYEGLSNALMEALCVGTACIATDSPTYGNRFLINDGENGFLVPVNDEVVLSKRILQLAKDDNLMKRFEKNGMMLYSQANKDCIVTEWENYIKKILYHIQ